MVWYRVTRKRYWEMCLPRKGPRFATDFMSLNDSRLIFLEFWEVVDIREQTVN